VQQGEHFHHVSGEYIMESGTAAQAAQGLVKTQVESDCASIVTGMSCLQEILHDSTEHGDVRGIVAHGQNACRPTFDGEPQLVGVVEVFDGESRDTKASSCFHPLKQAVREQEAERLANTTPTNADLPCQAAV
jgi:hypothetical protein